MVAPDGIKWSQNSAVLSGDPRKEGAPFVLRLKFAGGAKIPPHWHPVDEHLTVISGTFFMGQGEIDKHRVLFLWLGAGVERRRANRPVQGNREPKSIVDSSTKLFDLQ